MIYIPHSIGLIIATCFKCASNSITNEFKAAGVKPLSHNAVVELKKSNWKVIGIVRDPIDRLESAYNFFKYGQQGNFPTGQYNDIKDFIDAVLAGVTDEHWRPQSSMLLLCDKFADLETMNISKLQNTSPHYEKVEHRIEELNNFYSQDFVLRGGAWV